MSDGINIKLEDVAEIKNGYWKVFKGMNNAKWDMKDTWERNKGYILNAIGRPAPIGEHHLKDLFSRSVQGGGSDINMMFGMYIADLVKQHQLDAYPIIYNLHDAVYYQVRKEQLEQYLQIKQQAEDLVWKFCKNKLNWNCRLHTSQAWGENLKQLKECVG